ERELPPRISRVVLGKESWHVAVVPAGEPEAVHRHQPAAWPQKLSPVGHRASWLAEGPEQVATGHGIEAGRREAERHGVAETGVNREATGGGVGDQLVEHGRGQIDSRHTVAEKGRRQGQVAGTARYIEEIA